jgi:hypothetical protein
VEFAGETLAEVDCDEIVGCVGRAAKHIVPTESGLSLFGVLKQADPVLVDPGVTAQLECLLDDVVVGKQEMVSAIDAVCDVAQRIIGKLKDGAAAGGPRHSREGQGQLGCYVRVDRLQPTRAAPQAPSQDRASPQKEWSCQHEPNLIIGRKHNVVLPFCYPTR